MKEKNENTFDGVKLYLKDDNETEELKSLHQIWILYNQGSLISKLRKTMYKLRKSYFNCKQKLNRLPYSGQRGRILRRKEKAICFDFWFQ